jgi:AraC family transcriptional regulator
MMVSGLHRHYDSLGRCAHSGLPRSPFAHCAGRGTSNRGILSKVTQPWLSTGDVPWRAVQVSVPAGRYLHPASGALVLRLVRRGSSHFVIDFGTGRQRVYTRPGDLLLSLPDNSTSFDLDDARDLLIVSVAGKRADELVSRAGGVGLHELAPLIGKPFRNTLAAELCRRLNDSDGQTDASLDDSLAVLVASLLAQARSVSAQAGASRLKKAALTVVLNHVDANVDKQLSVDELAALAGLPRRIFAAEFKRAIGMPVYQYVLRRRVDRATALLSARQLSIAEVAAEVGFTHQAHMSRVVRRLTGLTPAQLRGRAVSSAADPEQPRCW